MVTTVPALWLKNRRLAYAISNDYFVPGSERQDVEQEALIALWVACRDHDSDKGPFKPWAVMVIRHHLIECVRLATRQKHRPLNDSLRTVVSEDGDLDAIADHLPCLHQVTDRVEDREHLRAVLHAIDHDLTDLERQSVIGIARGLSYAEIGNPDQVDNALMRARVKLRAAA